MFWGMTAMRQQRLGSLFRRDRARERERMDQQRELGELLALSTSAAESEELLIRHLQRSLPGIEAAVLHLSDVVDRLEVTLGPRGETGRLLDLAGESVAPDSCLAFRLRRPYHQHPGQEPLLRCETCGKVAAELLCEPLQLAGQAIASVLVASEQRLNDDDEAIVRDSVLVTAPFRANQRNMALVERRAASDALTGLPNRRAAYEAITRMAAHAGRTITPLSAVLLDLDRFRQVNDLHGHDRGDKALAAIGQILAASLRASDFAARYGGAEFLLLLPDTDRSGALDVAERIRRVLERTELREAGRLTASFGLATLPDDAVEPEALIRRADRALYAAKARGRNRVEVAEANRGFDLPRPGLPGPEAPGSDPRG